MNSFGGWLAERRFPRILLIAGTFPLGLLGVVSPAAVVMTAIVRGWRTALEDTGMALVVLAGVVVAAGGSLQVLLLSGALTWGSALALGTATGHFASLTLPVQLLVLVGAAGVVVFGAVVGDVVAFWEPILQTFASQLGELGLDVADPAVLAPLAPMMTGLAAISIISGSVIALLLGSWWAAGANGPGFAAMFLRLRMGLVLGIATAIAGIAALFNVGWMANSLLLVLGTGFALQGIAVLHWQARARSWPWPLLAVVYLPLVLGPIMISFALLMFASIGFVDNWYGLRRGSVDVIK
ncbi:MAG: hypothetical protein QNJ73_15075 [Gammaproteobacteria bacterium]|nr:hypothetical protein [Gammaproteobacteria bacterium]